MQYGFIKVAAAVPTVKVADCQYNLKKIPGALSYRLHLSRPVPSGTSLAGF